jgi:hypothetical protein
LILATHLTASGREQSIDGTLVNDDPEFFRRRYAETAIRARFPKRESLKKIQHIPQHIRERAPGFTPTE